MTKDGQIKNGEHKEKLGRRQRYYRDKRQDESRYGMKMWGSVIFPRDKICARPKFTSSRRHTRPILCNK